MSGETWRICSVAWMPFIPGIDTSITTRSGRQSNACCTAIEPSLTCPTTSISDCALISSAKPSRTMAWSSTNRIRSLPIAATLRFFRGKWDTHEQRRAMPRLRLDRQCSANQRHPLLHAEQSKFALHALLLLASIGGKALTIVFDDQEDVISASLQNDADVLSMGVFKHIGQRLLNDAVQHNFHLR